MRKLANGVLQVTTLQILNYVYSVTNYAAMAEFSREKAGLTKLGAALKGAWPRLLSRPKGFLIISHLSDIYCELDYM
jgi:hypothetical protein